MSGRVAHVQGFEIAYVLRSYDHSEVTPLQDCLSYVLLRKCSYPVMLIHW